MMYMSWRKKVLAVQEQRISQIEETYRGCSDRIKELRALESAEICHNADVVGFTTTGAARQRALLEHLKPTIVIVEEAAEVLEAHVICALSTSCQQLILIGDHKQLKPPVVVYRLAKEFRLDVSLFERMIINGLEPCVLDTQHRMRPEIAKLIVPGIYPTLKNHSSVLEYPPVRGLSSNVFFLSHTEKEVGDSDGKSPLNPYEADLSLALARHLLMQGYEPERITILTTYSGQLLHFWKLRRNHPTLQGVRISVVDNFQGEENDIVILSLVRSNEEENIGFLRIENRICVALSRAKQGFYVIGNLQNLKGKSKLWDGVSRILDSNGFLGMDFPLKCEIHDTAIKARQMVNFPPEGGCMEKCATVLPCKHTCPKLCHMEDRDHVLVKCAENCNRTCSFGHPCPGKCIEDCFCSQMMTKILPCSHEQLVPCFKNPAEEFCKTIMWKISPLCGHGMDIYCGASFNDVICPELCGMTLDCGHICPLKCHKNSSHTEILCRQPCQRLCEEQHACSKECHENCGKCLEMTKKILPCGHEEEVECCQLPQDVYCRVKVEKVLPNCQHTSEMECSKSTDGFKCECKCEKLLCRDGHPCKKQCFEPCGPCFVRMERAFECGHTSVMECFVDKSKIRCRVPKKCLLPCEHRVDIDCGEDPSEARCPLPCDVRLECGHTCTRKCHLKNDPDHEEYTCKKACERNKKGCKKNHKCGKQCYELCENCCEKWMRTLPCGHSVFIECFLNDDEIICSELVMKMIPECGHQVKLACSTEPTRSYCTNPCVRVLSCGHLCKKMCNEPCSETDCIEPVSTTVTNACGHHVTVMCKLYKEDDSTTALHEEAHLQMCFEPCNAVLECEHICKGTCGGCFNGRFHRGCDDDCGRSLVCGHRCNVSCGLLCPPCNRKCEYKCPHSKCRLKCCEPCSPCKELCQWSCEHQKCTRKCSEHCNRARCDEPCKKMLPCGHYCAGLCGEICPPLCRVCDKDKLTEFMLLGNEENEDARFIFLPDCGHSIEVEGMDRWMDADGDGHKQIQPKCCPRCKTSILTCMRYGDIIKDVFGDVAKAKQKIFNMRENPMGFFNRCSKQLFGCRQLISKFIGLQLHSSIVKIQTELLSIDRLLLPKKNAQGKQINPCIGSNERFHIEVKLDFIHGVLEMIETLLTNPIKSEFAEEFYNRILTLLNSLINRPRISVEEYRALTGESDRLEYVRAYFVLQSNPSFPEIGLSTPENKLIQQMLMKSVQVLSEDGKMQIKAALDKLGGGVAEKERREIVLAMGMQKGHWFKCPNGHVYAIGNCGGAMEESICNEYHALIGGTRHRLRDDNQFAGEIDDAERPAWI